MYREMIDYADYSDLLDNIYGGTNPDCPGHDYVDAQHPNGDTYWCDYLEDCPEAR